MENRQYTEVPGVVLILQGNDTQGVGLIYSQILRIAPKESNADSISKLNVNRSLYGSTSWGRVQGGLATLAKHLAALDPDLYYHRGSSLRLIPSCLRLITGPHNNKQAPRPSQLSITPSPKRPNSRILELKIPAPQEKKSTS